MEEDPGAPCASSTPLQGTNVNMLSPSMSEASSLVGRGRGRRRGRGRGNGVARGTRSRGRGRGQGQSQEPQQSCRKNLRFTVSEQERLNKLRSIRKEACRNSIDKLSVEKMRKIMLDMVESSPELMFDIINAPDGPPPPPPPPGSVPWCVCGNCREMSRDIEKVCCANAPERCTSRQPEFEHVALDRIVVRLAAIHAGDMWAYNPPNSNEVMRFSAYRQYILLKHQKLGKGNLKVIPSCCLWRIRDTFPDPHGQYRDFDLRGGQLV